MNILKKVLGGAILALAAAGASAAPVFVGSWDLYSGVNWWTGEAPTYTGQEAAAALFGGSASDYVISTNGSNVADINQSAWYDQYGIGPAIFAQDYRHDTFNIGVYDTYGDTSAMIRDNAGGQNLMNYAFRVDGANVPEPLTVGLMGLGLAGMAVARRRQAK